MKRLVCILILLLISAQALAVENGSVEVTVTVNKEPSIGSFQPADGYKIYEGDILEITVDATDPNEGDILQYQFVINEDIKQSWGLESSFSYTLEGGDIGQNSIAVEVTDGVEIIQTQEVEIYVFRMPVAPPSL